MSEQPIITLTEMDQFFNDVSYDFDSASVGIYNAFKEYLKKNNEEKISEYLERFRNEFGEALSDHLMKPSFIIGRVEHQKYAGIEYSNPMIGYMLRRLNGVDQEESYRKLKQSIKFSLSDENIQERIEKYGEEESKYGLYPARELVEKIAHKYLGQLEALRTGLGTKTMNYDGSAEGHVYVDDIMNG